MARGAQAFAVVVVCCYGSGWAQAASFTVNSTNDAVDVSPGDGVCETGAGNGVCTLRAAIQETNALAGADVINLPANTYTLSLVGSDTASAVGSLDVTDSLSLKGAGAATTIIDGGGATLNDNALDLGVGKSALTISVSNLTVRNAKGRAVYARGNNTHTLDHLVLTTSFQGLLNDGTTTVTSTTFLNNTGGSGSASGGGADNNSASAVLVIKDSTFTGNAALNGGGAWNGAGTMTLTNCTLSGNSAASGGGLASQATTVLNNVTIAGNAATGADGGIGVFGTGTTTLSNSIVAGNTGSSSPDCGGPGTLTSGGYDLIGNTTGCTLGGSTAGVLNNVDPMLGPLQDNGGPTQTRALGAGSPAINAGNPATPGGGGSTCELADQIGTPRTACDIGAFEVPPPPDLAAPVDLAQASDLADNTAADLAAVDDLGAPTDLAADAGTSSHESGCSLAASAAPGWTLALVLVCAALAFRRHTKVVPPADRSR